MWVACWSWYQDHPEKKQSVNNAELELIQSGTEKHDPDKLTGASWTRAFTNRNLWVLYWMYFTAGFVYYLYISWFPTIGAGPWHI